MAYRHWLYLQTEVAVLQSALLSSRHLLSIYNYISQIAKEGGDQYTVHHMDYVVLTIFARIKLFAGM